MEIERKEIFELIEYLYGKESSEHIFNELIKDINDYKIKIKNSNNHTQNVFPTEKDTVIITYADQVIRKNEKPLRTLNSFLKKYLDNAISTVHLLPFFPYSSDDGFSIIDYYQVDRKIGNWDDISRIGKSFHLMFDAVINHISRESDWFQSFLKNREPYNKYFITVEPDIDLSNVTRPRTLPLLTEVDTLNGKKYVWTTFSEDQIDLNYANPNVLIDITRVLLFYAYKGADIIRLDAIAYLWKDIDTNCIHLNQTHAIIKLWRLVFNEVKPNLILITETNVPHNENITYFGKLNKTNGKTDEAQMVYQFPLAPLVLYTFQAENTEKLISWLNKIDAPGIFFNFLASHDGIGVLPAKDLLTEDEINSLVTRTLNHGGKVSKKNNPDGTQSVYELNITFYDWLNDPNNIDPKMDIKRFLASQAIMLSIAGLPGIYFHSLFGFRNCQKCVQKTGRARSINREKFSFNYLSSKLNDPTSTEAQVFQGYKKLLEIRRYQIAFHPSSIQIPLIIDSRLFSIMRISKNNKQFLLVFINVTSESYSIKVNLTNYNFSFNAFEELISHHIHKLENNMLRLIISPYQVLWLTNIKMP